MKVRRKRPSSWPARGRRREHVPGPKPLPALERSSHRGLFSLPTSGWSSRANLSAHHPVGVTVLRHDTTPQRAPRGAGTQQSLAGLGLRDDTPHVARELERTIYPHQIAFNCLPHIGGFYPEGDTEEERKLVNETHKIFADDSIAITGTTVRVPVFRAHSEIGRASCRERV